jgi:hypothetical protein
MLKAKSCYRRPETRAGKEFAMLRGMSDRAERHGYPIRCARIQIQALNNLVTELKKVKDELEDTLEKNETYCHQWGAHLASAYRRVL